MSPERWSEIESLYQAALEREPKDRAAFLASTGADEQVRSEVKSLLAHIDAGDLLLEHGAASMGVPTQIGPYVLEEVVGQGGMGVVYRALDTKLNRAVAVKFLSDELADSEARRRFQREAQTASSLNHPHILTVHDAGELNGRQYLVTELVDGGTLSDWAAAEKREWWQVVELLVGVADGLAVAHEAGILHRDIKPANILVTRSGYAKLADFGLAKLAQGDDGTSTGEAGGDHSGTGLVIGTPAYLAPEHASGQSFDARSDIFSFGLVLYEMLAGKRAFGGATNAELIQKIIDCQVPPLPVELPAALRRVVEKALQRQPSDRFATTREFVAELRHFVRNPEKVVGPLVSRGWSRFAWVGAGIAAVVAGAAFFVRPPESRGPDRLQYEQITNFTDSARAPALSPDGRMVAFIRGGAYFQSRGQVYVKALPDGTPVQVTNEPDLKYGPVFSPDGRRIAFTLLKPGGSWETWAVPTAGGESTRLLLNASGLSWVGGDRVLFSAIESGTGTHMGIVSSAEDRSGEQTIYFPSHKRAMAHYSYASPDRNWILVVEMDRTAEWQPCLLMAMDGSQRRAVGPKGACLAAGWSPDGKWMYFSAEVDGAWHLWRQPFPAGSVEQITFGPSEEEGLAVSPDGQSLITSVGVRRSSVWIHDATGERPVVSEGIAFGPRWSADGTRVFYLDRQNPLSPGGRRAASGQASPRLQSGSLRSVSLATGASEALLPGHFITTYDLSPDGQRVAFSTMANKESNVWLGRLDGTESPRLIERNAFRPAFAGNEEITYTSSKEDRNFLYRTRIDGSGRERVSDIPILGGSGTSPGGEWRVSLVASEEQQSNWRTVAIRTHGGGTREICRFYCALTWSADGKYLYVTPDLAAKRTFVIPLPHQQLFPDLPANGAETAADLLNLPGAQSIGIGSVSPGLDPSTYLYSKGEFQSNLFRIRLH